MNRSSVLEYLYRTGRREMMDKRVLLVAKSIKSGRLYTPCPFCAIAKKAVDRYNLLAPSEKSIEVVYDDYHDGNTQELIQVTQELLGGLDVPVLYFEGFFIVGASDVNYYYEVLQQLSRGGLDDIERSILQGT